MVEYKFTTELEDTILRIEKETRQGGLSPETRAEIVERVKEIRKNIARAKRTHRYWAGKGAFREDD